MTHFQVFSLNLTLNFEPRRDCQLVLDGEALRAMVSAPGSGGAHGAAACYPNPAPSTRKVWIKKLVHD